MTTVRRPGGEMASRPLHFFWVLDCSGSMAGTKIQQLNFAIRECIPAMQDEAIQNPECQMFVRVLTFSSGARWHVGQPHPVASFKWTDVQADGVTDMGHAMELLAEALSMDAMGERALPPVLVLITDGQPTDDFAGGLKKLMDNPWAKKAVRIGIAIGDDGDLDVLEKFIAHPEFKPLRADNAPTLAKYIKWASTAVVKSASSPVSQGAGAGSSRGSNVDIPPPPQPDPPEIIDVNGVW
jgi:uncharacterized protein YegL